MNHAEENFSLQNQKIATKSSFGERIRGAFITGLLLCLPISLTIYIIIWLVNFLASPARGGLTHFLVTLGIEPQETFLFRAGVTLISALFVAVGLVLIGFISRNLFGRFFIGVLEKILHRLPMVRSIYSAIKQIIDTFSGGGKEKKFSRAVLVEFPRTGCWTIGFLTYEGETEFSRIAGTPLVHVFVPTTPNPTGGYMILVPANEVKFLDVSVSEAMTMIVSGGAAVPKKNASAQADSSEIISPASDASEK